MDTNAYVEAVARSVSDAIQAAGESTLSVATATNIPRTTLIRRLSGSSSFTISELHQIANVVGTSVSGLLSRAEVPA